MPAPKKSSTRATITRDLEHPAGHAKVIALAVAVVIVGVVILRRRSSSATALGDPTSTDIPVVTGAPADAGTSGDLQAGVSNLQLSQLLDPLSQQLDYLTGQVAALQPGGAVTNPIPVPGSGGGGDPNGPPILTPGGGSGGSRLTDPGGTAGGGSGITFTPGGGSGGGPPIATDPTSGAAPLTNPDGSWQTGLDGVELLYVGDQLVYRPSPQDPYNPLPLQTYTLPDGSEYYGTSAGYTATLLDQQHPGGLTPPAQTTTSRAPLRSTAPAQTDTTISRAPAIKAA